jgi:hypothetical protein
MAASFRKSLEPHILFAPAWEWWTNLELPYTPDQLRKDYIHDYASINTDVFQSDYERELYNAFIKMRTVWQKHLDADELLREEYQGKFDFDTVFGEINALLVRFFANCSLNDPDPIINNNRLLLLYEIHELCYKLTVLPINYSPVEVKVNNCKECGCEGKKLDVTTKIIDSPYPSS